MEHATSAPRGLLAAAVLALLVVGAPPARADGERDARRSPIVEIAARARDAVVSIHTTQVIERHFYGFELPPVSGKGIGSGAIFHPAGYVITNAHVLNRASEVLVDVTQPDGSMRTHPASIFAVDVANDLAILRLQPPEGVQGELKYPWLPLGRSNDLMPGETVVAIGNPFGIGLTVTSGIIGGINRTLRFRERDERVFSDFIQIDLALNPGNSGGPLFDVTGRWIGVNTAIWNRLQDPAEGLGFAIPVDRVRSLIGRTFKRRLMTGEWLGIDLEEGEGGQAVVQYVFPRGPARDALLRPGDVLTSLNGEAMPTLFDLRWRMAFLPRGAVARFGVARDGKPLREGVVLPLLAVPTDELSAEHLGFVASDVSEEANRELQVAFNAGVVVQSVRPGGPAARIGLKPGDLVEALGSYQIRHSDDLLVFLQYVQPADIVQVVVRRLVGMPGGRVLSERSDGTMVAQ